MPKPSGTPQQVFAQRVIMAGFAVFLVTLLSCFLTIRFGFESAKDAPRWLMMGFMGGGILAVLMELCGMVLLVRASRK